VPQPLFDKTLWTVGEARQPVHRRQLNKWRGTRVLKDVQVGSSLSLRSVARDGSTVFHGGELELVWEFIGYVADLLRLHH